MVEAEILDPVAAGMHLGGTKPLSPQALAIHRLHGTGPQYCKIGRLVRYRRADLDDWMTERMRFSTSQAA